MNALMNQSVGDPAGHEATVEVLYEDEALLAVNKPAGMVTHPAYRHPNGTLWDAALERQMRLGLDRPWLLHRLDRETSGVVLFAKTAEARRALVGQFERHTIQKRYLALLAGRLPDHQGTIDAPLARDSTDRRRTIVAPAGQPSCTRYQTLATENGVTLALAEPVTGRTRQIRAHLAWVGAPLLGDAQYYPERHWGALAAPRAMLHAWRLGCQHPGTGARMTIAAPIPPDFMAVAARFELDNHLRAVKEQMTLGAPADKTEEIPCN
jgi:23S rRNA pseudouridine1911/1915/1917 synthase